jgi:6-phosphofructokinase 1
MVVPKIKHIGLLTSGGDAPGMNAAIRAVVRSAIFNGLRVSGIHFGYNGLLSGDIHPMNEKSVSGIINRGGTILGAGRSEEFKTKEGLARAARVCQHNKLDALMIIGGDGSFRGALELFQLHNIASVGIPGSIDNDVAGTDLSIGFDTAVNTAMSCIDKLRDTAEAHERIFVVEVMGKESGEIAIDVAIASGAEGVIIPEVAMDIPKLCQDIRKGIARGKSSFIIVVAEGATSAYHVAKHLEEARLGRETRVLVLGHLQRGGPPTALDREIASKMGAYAVDLLLLGKTACFAGVQSGVLVDYPLSYTWEGRRPFDVKSLELAKRLAI